jgi:two-component system sensor histidine kinase AlgZ
MNTLNKIDSIPKADALFLPNFCQVYTVFIGVILTELLAFVLTLAPLSKSGYDWEYVKQDLITDLAMISLFMQWITLISMALLCVLRHWLCRLSNLLAGLFSYLLILCVTGLVSEVAYQLVIVPVESLMVQANETQQLFFWRNLGMSALLSAIALRYFYLQYHWKQETEATAYARFQALQARIRPHFLFNSMNTIASLIRFQPQQAEQAVIDFAEVFRASLIEANHGVTLQQELEWCQQYLHLEKLRLAERLNLIWQIDSLPQDAILPPLCLQPLVENAIYHGIQALSAGGTIKITGQFNGSQIKIDISNPLPQKLSVYRGQQMAQLNIQQRLHYFYGSQAKLAIQTLAGIYQVSLTFPYHNQYDENTYR